MQKAYVILENREPVAVDVADSDASRTRGLMFRPTLSDREGMLFVFARPDRYAFWMKNVRMPLDIIWLDESHRVVWIVHEAPPCGGEACVVYQPPRNATFVIEVTGGFARLEGIRIGERVTISPR